MINDELLLGHFKKKKKRAVNDTPRAAAWISIMPKATQETENTGDQAGHIMAPFSLAQFHEKKKINPNINYFHSKYIQGTRTDCKSLTST